MIKKIGLPIVIIALAILIFASLKLTRPETAANERPERKWLVEAVTAEYSTVSPEITIYGRVETPRDVTLKAALEADVITVSVLEGEKVLAGQTLAKLDETDVQLQLMQRQADVAEVKALIDSEQNRFKRDKGLLENQKKLVELANAAVKRANKLEQSRLASKATLDEALAAYQQQLLALKQLEHDINEHPARLAQLKASLNRSQSLLQQAQVELGRTEIKAPFAGRVASLDIAVGDRVRAGDSLVSVYDLDNLEVRAQIPGRYVNQVRTLMQQGKKLSASADLDGLSFGLQLKRLSGEVRQDSGGLDGLFSIENNVEPLPLGTFVELQLQLAEQQNVIEIPFSALYGLERVYLVKEGFLQAVSIQRVGEVTSEQGKNSLLVRSAEIAPGDKIAITQLPNAITGLRVEIAE